MLQVNGTLYHIEIRYTKDMLQVNGTLYHIGIR